MCNGQTQKYMNSLPTPTRTHKFPTPIRKSPIWTEPNEVSQPGGRGPGGLERYRTLNPPGPARTEGGKGRGGDENEEVRAPIENEEKGSQSDDPPYLWH